MSEKKTQIERIARARGLGTEPDERDLEGYAAASAAHGKTCNPYKRGTESCELWDAGYDRRDGEMKGKSNLKEISTRENGKRNLFVGKREAALAESIQTEIRSALNEYASSIIGKWNLRESLTKTLLDDVETDAWLDGYKAFLMKAEGHIIENPYDNESPEWDEWEDGFSSAGDSLDEGLKKKSMQLLKEWDGRLQDAYDGSFEEFEEYNEIYGIARRLGYETTTDAWEANPLIAVGVDPSDLRVIRENKMLKEELKSILSESSAWEKGYEAFLDGRPNGANPFKDDEEKYDEWLDGWLGARDASKAGPKTPVKDKRVMKEAITLDYASASDREKITDFLDTERIGYGIVYGKYGPLLDVDLERETLNASVILSHLHRIAKFEEVGHATEDRYDPETEPNIEIGAAVEVLSGGDRGEKGTVVGRTGGEWIVDLDRGGTTLAVFDDLKIITESKKKKEPFDLAEIMRVTKIVVEQMTAVKTTDGKTVVGTQMDSYNASKAIQSVAASTSTGSVNGVVTEGLDSWIGGRENKASINARKMAFDDVVDASVNGWSLSNAFARTFLQHLRHGQLARGVYGSLLEAGAVDGREGAESFQREMQGFFRQNCEKLFEFCQLDSGDYVVESKFDYTVEGGGKVSVRLEACYRKDGAVTSLRVETPKVKLPKTTTEVRDRVKAALKGELEEGFFDPIGRDPYLEDKMLEVDMDKVKKRLEEIAKADSEDFEEMPKTLEDFMKRAKRMR